ncbi:protein phosphatase CheZ [Roseococcus suduntuyensis]|uniref:Chemotaxis protein CheZ n=1 Tax=Roseococcus suduntuyensis TaxID=455361 RepID=A0A840AJ36_9PROT|nr:protein phosphatase CheZ [Roseococcus suduntuyensis]MBB3900055.1 chemotaxis protein CheZ [Roseococcus suduntuyensis]
MTTDSTEQLRDAVRAELHPALADLHRFVDRRIAELSAELHASVEIADMGEEQMKSALARIHDQIGQLVAVPAAATRNSGLELEAVVQATEAAANTIMEAAEAIQAWVASGAQDKDAVAAIAARVSSIFEACTFQDVTGQRIRRAIQHLQQVENMLETMIPAGSRPEGPREQVEVKTAMRTVESPAGGDIDQAAIDALLNDF